VVFTCFVGHIIAYWERELRKKIRPDELEPVTWELYQESLKTTGTDYLVAVQDLQRFARKIANWYHRGNFDVLLSPTMRIPPTRLGAFKPSAQDPGSAIRVALSFIAFTRTQNITGQPAMSVPLYWNEANIPIGVQFAGRYGEEGKLFRLAALLEQARPWADKIPPIHSSKI
jgi:amidase